MVPQLPEIGLVEWFRPPVKGEKQRAENVIEFLSKLDHLKYLRTDISWARCYEYKEPVLDFYDWLFNRLKEAGIKPIPNIMYTPPELTYGGCYASPPKDIEMYAEFVKEVMNRWGENFEYIELWNEPNAVAFYRHDLDPGWSRFRKMIKAAAKEVAINGKKAVLGGMSHPSPGWLGNMYWDYALKDISAIGFHSFPGSLQSNIGNHPWTSWVDAVYHLNKVINSQENKADLWITETGASSTLGKYEQLIRFSEALKAPVSKMFWYSVQDFEGYLMEESAGIECSDALLNMGICSRGSNDEVKPKYLADVWINDGLEGIIDVAENNTEKKILL